MNEAVTVNHSLIQKWIADNFEIQKIRDELISFGYDNITVEAYIKEFKKLKYGKRQAQGFVLLVTGAFVGFISCVLTIINPIPEIYYWILYGLTSIAVGLICAGLYYLFE